MVIGLAGDIMIVGIERENIDRLTSGNPLVIKITDGASPRSVVVLFRETAGELTEYFMESSGPDTVVDIKGIEAAEHFFGKVRT
jgi:hypothetical protein